MKRDLYKSGNQKFSKRERLESFWSKVRVSGIDECWEWKAGKDWKGYGTFHNEFGYRHAHRYILSVKLKRRLKREEQALHKCDNRGCVNPKHLFVGSNLDNVRDRIKKGRPGAGGGARLACTGENNNITKLTTSKVLEIRASKERSSILAREHGVSRELIWLIRSRRIWRHLP